MAHISIQNLTVEFKVYGTSSRSLRKEVLFHATGGRIASGSKEVVTVKGLDDVSLEIGDGERIGLIGHNGAGKSTLLRALAGIYKPTGGAIDIDGTVSALLDPAAGMDPEATGRENVFLRGCLLGLTRKQIHAKVDEIGEFAGLGDFLELPVKTYSAGMHARLGVAISLAIEPDILLIDEGISAGDAQFQQKLDAVIDRVFAQSSILILASHDQNLLRKYCHRVVSFAHGKIVDVTPITAQEPDSAAA